MYILNFDNLKEYFKVFQNIILKRCSKNTITFIFIVSFFAILDSKFIILITFFIKIIVLACYILF